MLKTKSHYSFQYYYLEDDGTFPNSHLPVLIYKNIIEVPFFFPAFYLKKIFKSNNWYNAWQSGIFEYHHYHSNTHEVMGVYKGKTKFQIGGDKGIELEIEKGDVLILPAGVAHKNLGKENDIKCVGAYPNGKEYDINYGKKGERPKTIKNILKVKVPDNDPVYGMNGVLKRHWQ